MGRISFVASMCWGHRVWSGDGDNRPAPGVNSLFLCAPVGLAPTTDGNQLRSYAKRQR